jgi:hypothetical protein
MSSTIRMNNNASRINQDGCEKCLRVWLLSAATNQFRLPRLPVVAITTAALAIWWGFSSSSPANDNNPSTCPPSAPAAVRPSPAPANDNVESASKNRATKRKEGRVPASIRFNNVGAQYPASWAKKFGMDGSGIIGGGHLIAHFPNPVAGAAANMYLLAKSYVGMPIGTAGVKWTGGNGFGVPGYDPHTILTRELLNDPAFMIPFLKAIGRREAGKDSPLTDDQWLAAFNAFRAGKYP